MLTANPMKVLLAASGLLLGACASSPAAAPPGAAAKPVTAAAAAPAAATHICNPQARFVTFASLGVPAGEHAVDLVSTDDYDYVLASAFPAVRDAAEPLAMSAAMACSRVRLDRDPDGNVVVWDWRTRQLHRADAQGAWSEVDGGVFASLPDARALKGVDVGSLNEQWYFSGAAGLFLWKGKPVFLGAPTIRNRGRGADTMLLVPAPGGARELIETCYGDSVFRVAATASRYAAITHGGIVLGDLASAPDLQ
jgi:hypothetical protein